MFPKLDSDRTVLFVFMSPDVQADAKAIDELLRHYPTSHVVGCSTCGEILGSDLLDESLSVAVAKFDHTDIRSATCEINNPKDSYEAAVKLAEQLRGDKLRSVFVLSDGLNVNGSELAKGFNEMLPDGVTVSGGFAGDGPRFERTFVLKDGKPTTGVISAVGFYGDEIQVGHGSRGGWDKFGHERVVTRSEGNELFELDGKPALEIYKEYLGDKASELPASGLMFPLSIRHEQGGKKAVVRTILGVNEERNSMIFGGDIPQGSIAQFLYANFDRIIEGAADVANDSSEGYNTDSLTIGISCVCRRFILRDRTEEEIEAVVDLLPKGSFLAGFYSYGEISSLDDGTCEFHNQSMTLTTFQEAA